MDPNGSAGVDLPNDVLVEILGRLPGRSLAEFRGVCRAWRDLVDAHDLLRPHFFPRAFPGIFTNNMGSSHDPYFFSPPAARAPEADRLAFVWKRGAC